MGCTKVRNLILLGTLVTALYAPYCAEATDPYTSSSVQYNELTSVEWPGTGEWLDLSRSLSTFSELYGPFQSSSYDELCTSDKDVDTSDPFQVAVANEGLCMQYPSCANLYCLKDNNDHDHGLDGSSDKNNNEQKKNLPAYVLMAKTEDDIVKGMQFANEHNMQVTVKSSGHSVSGASTGQNSLLIWLAKFPVDKTIQNDYQDSCKDGTLHDVIGVAAGQNFKSIAEAVEDKYHFVSASEWSVSASGGFIQGGGLSYTSRKYGLGVDNVVDFRVVLPSGMLAVADRCTNPDLFWALRGGGGGTFGVVTHMNYKLHPATPIVRFRFNLGDYSNNSTIVSEFLKYWVEVGPNLDDRWGGRFTWFGLDLFFAGYQAGANLFVNDFMDWVEQTIELPDIISTANHTKFYPSWSAVLPDLAETTGQAYIPETSFSRLIPTSFATQAIKSYQLMETLAITRSMGYTNFLLGGQINEVGDDETSVNPAMRESTFLITANQIGYQKLLEVLPNNVTGVSKNHVNSLEPNWRESIWAGQYDELLRIKELVDPLNTLNCYQSVGYRGVEVDFMNVGDLVRQRVKPTVGTINTLSAGIASASVGIRLVTFLAAVSIYVLTAF